ncbi:unnamed protein product [Timema podura]|nr:unnamed protein product [Timema podura]
MWNEMSEEAKADYGEDYFEQRVLSLRYAIKNQGGDFSAILRTLSDAVSRTFPLPRYTPVTWPEKMQALVADHLPRSVYDILYT